MEELILKINSLKERRATRIIKEFYKTYVHCKRVNVDGLLKPIDPIYHIPFDDKFRLRLIHIYKCNKTGKNISTVFHFNIVTLVEWINTVKKYTNPLTNLNFTDNQINLIKKISNDNKLKIFEKKKCTCEHCQPKQPPPPPKELKLFELLLNDKFDETVDMLLKNHENIQNDNFNLNIINDKDMTFTHLFTKNEIEASNSLTINNYTLLHLCIIKNKVDIIDLLLMLGIKLNSIKSTISLLHLTVIFNLPVVAKQLIFLGEDLNQKCVLQLGDETNLNIDVLELACRTGNNDFISKIFD